MEHHSRDPPACSFVRATTVVARVLRCARSPGGRPTRGNVAASRVDTVMVISLKSRSANESVRGRARITSTSKNSPPETMADFSVDETDGHKSVRTATDLSSTEYRAAKKTPAPRSGASATHSNSTTYKKAGDGTRTRDLQLGKLTLYQLSYSRKSEAPCTITPHTKKSHRRGLNP
jgi:hypothetical protein